MLNTLNRSKSKQSMDMTKCWHIYAALLNKTSCHKIKTERTADWFREIQLINSLTFNQVKQIRSSIEFTYKMEVTMISSAKTITIISITQKKNTGPNISAGPGSCVSSVNPYCHTPVIQWAVETQTGCILLAIFTCLLCQLLAGRRPEKIPNKGEDLANSSQKWLQFAEINKPFRSKGCAFRGHVGVMPKPF